MVVSSIVYHIYILWITNIIPCLFIVHKYYLTFLYFVYDVKIKNIWLKVVICTFGILVFLLFNVTPVRIVFIVFSGSCKRGGIFVTSFPSLTVFVEKKVLRPLIDFRTLLEYLQIILLPDLEFFFVVTRNTTKLEGVKVRI